MGSLQILQRSGLQISFHLQGGMVEGQPRCELGLPLQPIPWCQPQARICPKATLVLGSCEGGGWPQACVQVCLCLVFTLHVGLDQESTILGSFLI